MKRLCTCFISMALLNQISFETNQKTKYTVDFNFIFILTEQMFWKYPNFLRKSGNQSKLYSTGAIMYS